MSILSDIATLDVPTHDAIPGYENLSDNDKWQVAVSTTLVCVLEYLRKQTPDEVKSYFGPGPHGHKYIGSQLTEGE